MQIAHSQNKMEKHGIKIGTGPKQFKAVPARDNTIEISPKMATKNTSGGPSRNNYKTISLQRVRVANKQKMQIAQEEIRMRLWQGESPREGHTNCTLSSKGSTFVLPCNKRILIGFSHPGK